MKGQCRNPSGSRRTGDATGAGQTGLARAGAGQARGGLSGTRPGRSCTGNRGADEITCGTRHAAVDSGLWLMATLWPQAAQAPHAWPAAGCCASAGSPLPAGWSCPGCACTAWSAPPSCTWTAGSTVRSPAAGAQWSMDAAARPWSGSATRSRQVRNMRSVTIAGSLNLPMEVRSSAAPAKPQRAPGPFKAGGVALRSIALLISTPRI